MLRFLNIFFLSLVFFFCQTRATETTALRPQIIFLGVDGFSYQAMATAQKKGLFKEFQFGAMLAPFPSMSDVSWNSILQTSKIFAEEGRLTSAEAVYFDESSQSVAGDVRDFYNRLAHPKYYLGGFDIFFNPYAEGLMYFPTKEIPKLEIKTVIDEILASPEKPVISGFIAGPDSLAHTQQGQLYPVLTLLDQEIKRLIEGMKQQGRQAHIILVSDHGNVGRFLEGSREIELLKIELPQILSKYRFNFVNTLQNDQDVAIPLLALGSWAPVYFKNQNLREEFLKKLSQESWFDIGVFVTHQTLARISVRVVGSQGQGELSYDKVKNQYSWKVIKGKVLDSDSFTNLNLSQIRQRTMTSIYPDAFFRIIHAVLNKDFDFPDALITSKDGYCFDNSLSQFTKMYRTHGSLSIGSSFGLVATNFSAVPKVLRSYETLNHFGLRPETLFQTTLSVHSASPSESLAEVKTNLSSGLATNARELSPKSLFLSITRFIADTRPFFLVSEIKELFSSFKFDTSKSDFKHLLKPEDIGRLADLILQTPTLQKFRDHPETNSILNQVEKKTGHNFNGEEQQKIFQANGAGVQSKRLAMKVFQIPPLLERALAFPEYNRIPETRDPDFAEFWIKSRQRRILALKNLTSLYHQKPIAEKLFSEAFNEALLEDRLFPTPLKRIYNRKLKDLTIVYVPGIYNSLFDQEIFSLGLKKLEEDFALRVLRIPTESACSIQYNGQILMDFLKNDFSRRQQRLGVETKYLIFGYSKGAVDALAGFTLAPEFVSHHIAGLLAIASPLQGSPILNRTDLPIELVEALSSQKAPQACVKDHSAGKSSTPNALAMFWRQHKSSLIGLTRYLSISFVSEIENSHLFMKATKLIAQFEEENDGVVPLSSSRFPEALGAIDFGQVNADHLAGVLSSKFNQKSFFQALVATLAELDLDNTQQNLKWNLQQIASQANEKHFWQRISIEENKSDFTIYQTQNFLWTKKIIQNATDSLQVNQLLLPRSLDPAASYQTQVLLPENQLQYEPDSILSVKSLSAVLEKSRVTPVSANLFPHGIDFEVNQKSVVEFRIDHQFNYENTSPTDPDENEKNGYQIVERDSQPWLQMKSSGTSVRMTTLSYRFRPIEFPKFSTRLYVTKPVADAQVIKGGSGKDDSAFQAWFILRVGNATKDRSYVDASKDRTVSFAYYWGTPTSGFEKQAGQIFENYYSKKNYVAVQLPESKELLLEDPNKLNQEVDIHRNFAEDLKKAFPDLKVEDLEVLAITFQHDSNDTKNESEAFLKFLKFEPLP